jgi:Spy/CpxP family protein refolding chaperone
MQELHPPSVGVLRSLEGETMILGKFTLAMFLLTAPAVWAQAPFSRADMMKLATDRFDTAAKTLNLSPDQVAGMKPLLQSKYVYMGQVKDVYMASAKSDAEKKNAKASLRAIHDKYNAQINTILTPEQAKLWKRMQKDWKDDLIVPKS